MSLPAYDDSQLEDSYNDILPDSQELNIMTDDSVDLTLTESELLLRPSDLSDLDIRKSSSHEDLTPKAEEIKFVTTHYKNSSESDESDDLHKGLSFKEDLLASQEELDSEDPTSEVASVASQMMTTAAGLVVSSATTGLTKLGQSVRAMTTNISAESQSQPLDQNEDTEDEFEVLSKEDFEK